jgi:hypothetical protein
MKDMYLPTKPKTIKLIIDHINNNLDSLIEITDDNIHEYVVGQASVHTDEQVDAMIAEYKVKFDRCYKIFTEAFQSFRDVYMSTSYSDSTEVSIAQCYADLLLNTKDEFNNKYPIIEPDILVTFVQAYHKFCADIQINISIEKYVNGRIVLHINKFVY